MCPGLNSTSTVHMINIYIVLSQIYEQHYTKEMRENFSDG